MASLINMAALDTKTLKNDLTLNGLNDQKNTGLPNGSKLSSDLSPMFFWEGAAGRFLI